MKSKNLLLYFLFIVVPIQLSGQLLDNVSITFSPPLDSDVSTYTIKIHDLPNNPSSEIHEDGADYRIFYVYGDGTFDNIYVHVPDDLLTIDFELTHTFNNTGDKKAYATITANYHDDDPPKKLPIGDFGIVNAENQLTSADSALKVSHSRDVVHGDTLETIITYGNICPPVSTFSGRSAGNNIIKFSYDYTKLKYEGVKGYYGEFEVLNFPGQVTVNVGNIADNYARNLLLIFTPTSFSNIGSSFNIYAEWDEVSHSGLNCLLDSVNHVSQTLVIEESHDPNFLIPDNEIFCIEGIEKMTYIIGFQNIGAGDAKKVIVDMILPDIFESGSIQMIDPPGLPFTYNSTNRQIIWELDTANNFLNFEYPNHRLKGIQNQSFNNPDSIHFTKDSIVFEVGFDPLYSIDPCEFIVCESNIVFDCNPDIKTNYSVTRIGCDLTGRCFGCRETVPITELADTIYDGNTPVLLKFDSIRLSGANKYVWYPKEGLHIPDSTIPEAYASPLRKTNYYLSASSGCPYVDTASYEVFVFPVDVECNLGINTNIIYTDCSPFEATLVLSVTGSTNLVRWNLGCYNGETVNNELFLPVLMADGENEKKYHFTVTDETTGCTAEKTVAVLRTNCDVVNIPCRAWILIGLLGIIIVFLLFRHLFQ